LRSAIGDPLFVRQGQRLVPTDYARRLAETLPVLMSDLEGLLTTGSGFDPATETASFTISGTDYFAELLMPELARIVSDGAPGVSFQLIGLDPRDYLAGVRSARSDLALIPAFELRDWAEETRAFTSEFAVIARRDHPATKNLATGATLPLDLFCDIAHVVFSVEGRRATQSDAVLANMGRSRHVAMTVADFSGAYRTVAASDLISVIPAELALSVAHRLKISVFRPPIPVGPTPIHMAWHRRSSRNPAHGWLRVTVAEILADLPRRYGLKTLAQAEIPETS
jgi:DNA-binding transcriptional LysR family regulator